MIPLDNCENKHMMVDIETLDVRPSAVVLSIGAALFNDKEVTVSFYSTLAVDPQLELGRTISFKTLRWWMDRPKSVIDSTFGSEIHPSTALCGFDGLSNFITAHNPKYLWANSPAFDCVILESLYRDLGLSIPWKYYQWLDFRTLYKNSDIIREKPPEEFAHNALTDAIAQANHVIKVLGNG